jgi:hypothetical protein
VKIDGDRLVAQGLGMSDGGIGADKDRLTGHGGSQLDDLPAHGTDL